MSRLAQQHRRRRSAVPLGGLFVIFAIIGVVTIVTLSIQFTFRVLDNDSEKKQFEDIIRPLVMFNPMPFENPNDIDSANLLLYSMWATLTGEKRGSYEIGDNAELVVPASDLDVAAAKLFGPNVELIHQSFSDYDTKYYYDDIEQVYNVPTLAQLLVYSPRVDEITKDGDFYNLLVAYVPPSNPWNAEYVGGTGTPIPDKYMIYVMRKDGDNYQIAKVQDAPTPASSSPEPGGEESSVTGES